MIRTAILVDGGFYRKRANHIRGAESPENAANVLYKYCQKHLLHGSREECSLYRVLYYDCAPSDKRVYHPLTGKTVDLAKGDLYKWSNDFLNELRNKRKFAIRLGTLAEEQAAYALRPDIVKELIRGKKAISDLSENDFYLSIKQKGVDTRIGIDIVSMSLKKQVDKIVLIAGDSDFVPAAKFARREGIDFVLDPMGLSIKDDLNEHIDGLNSFVGTLNDINVSPSSRDVPESESESD